MLALGRKHILIGISAEVVAEYVRLIESIFPGTRVLPVSCIDSVFGYLPTRSIVKEGGYESSGHFRLFGLSGGFRSDVEETVLSTLKFMATELQGAMQTSRNYETV